MFHGHHRLMAGDEKIARYSLTLKKLSDILEVERRSLLDVYLPSAELRLSCGSNETKSRVPKVNTSSILPVH